MKIRSWVSNEGDIVSKSDEPGVTNDISLRTAERNLKRLKRLRIQKLLKFFSHSAPPYRSSSAAMMLMLPKTATTSLIMWPSIILGKTW